MFANTEALEAWECVKVVHHRSEASDHKPVIATLKKKMLDIWNKLFEYQILFASKIFSARDEAEH